MSREAVAIARSAARAAAAAAVRTDVETAAMGAAAAVTPREALRDMPAPTVQQALVVGAMGIGAYGQATVRMAVPKRRFDEIGCAMVQAAAARDEVLAAASAAAIADFDETTTRHLTGVVSTAATEGRLRAVKGGTGLGETVQPIVDLATGAVDVGRARHAHLTSLGALAAAQRLLDVAQHKAHGTAEAISILTARFVAANREGTGDAAAVADLLDDDVYRRVDAQAALTAGHAAQVLVSQEVQQANQQVVARTRQVRLNEVALRRLEFTCAEAHAPPAPPPALRQGPMQPTKRARTD